MDFSFLLIALPIMLIFGALYFVFFAQKDKARQRFEQVVEESVNYKPSMPTSKKDIVAAQYVLKRKRKQEQTPKLQKLDTRLEQANLLLKPIEFIYIQIGCGFIGAILPLIFGLSIFLAPVAGIVAYVGANMFINIKIALRMKKAEAMFPDVLEMMVSSFKSGYGFNKCTAMVADSFDDPWGTEFNKLTVEMNLGTSQEEALANMARRVPTEDMKLFTAALGIQKETGGNMVEILSILSSTIRDRFKLKGKVGTLTAQGKLSAIIVFCVPFLLGGVIGLILPDIMMNFINSAIGKIGLAVAGTLQCIGGFVLKKIVTIEV